MLLPQKSFRHALLALAASIPIIIVFIAVLSILLAAAQSFHLSSLETTSWIVSVYALPGLLCLAVAIRYRQPLILTGNVFALIFFASLGGQISYPELVGASMLSGVVVLLVGVFGLTEHVAAWLPLPIVLGLLAGAVTPYVAGIFTALGNEPVMIGGTLLAYLLARRFLAARVPPILPALVVGLALAGFTGHLGPLPSGWSPPALVFTPPSFTVQAIATVTPVLVVLILVQSNLPSVIYLQSQGYQPAERTMDRLSGAGTFVGSLFGPTAVSLALQLISLAAGPEAGQRETRHWAAYLAAAALILIGLLAGVAASLATIIPLPLLLTLAGLALEPVLAYALQAITRGPLLLGPLFAFVIALSKISLFGFGPYFWSLVFGVLISLLLERKEMSAEHANMLANSAPH